MQCCAADPISAEEVVADGMLHPLVAAERASQADELPSSFAVREKQSVDHGQLAFALRRFEESQAETASAARHLTAVLRSTAAFDPLPRPKAENAAPLAADGCPSSSSTQPKEVVFKLTVQRVFDVNTLAQTFSAQLNIVMFWKLPAGEQPPDPSEDDGDWTPEWTPKYDVRNLLEEKYTHVQYGCVEKGDETLVVCEASHLVIISEALELRDFPFDCQDLDIQIQSRMPVESMIWVRPEFDVNAQGCLLNDFKLSPEIPFTSKLFRVDRDYKTVARADIKMKVHRRAFYYILNVAVVMAIICSFVLTAWVLHPAALSERFSIDFSLILTSIAFKLVLTEMLPPVSYMTILDVFVLVCFLFLCVVTLSHAVLPTFYIDKRDISALTLPPLSFEDEMSVINTDTLSFWIFCGCWVTTILFFCIFARVRSHSIYREFMQKAKSEQEENAGKVSFARSQTVKVGR